MDYILAEQPAPRDHPGHPAAAPGAVPGRQLRQQWRPGDPAPAAAVPAPGGPAVTRCRER